MEYVPHLCKYIFLIYIINYSFLGTSVAAVTLLNRSGFNMQWYGNILALGSHNPAVNIQDAILRKINQLLIKYNLHLHTYVEKI